MASEELCAICLDLLAPAGGEGRTRELACGHQYHESCVAQLRRHQPLGAVTEQCPQCRHGRDDVLHDLLVRGSADLTTGQELFDQAVLLYGEQKYVACLSAIQTILDDLQAAHGRRHAEGRDSAAARLRKQTPRALTGLGTVGSNQL